MIEKAEFYGMSCDMCGKLHVNFHEHAWFGDAATAKEEALENGWVEQEGKHYCPECAKELKLLEEEQQ